MSCGHIQIASFSVYEIGWQVGKLEISRVVETYTYLGDGMGWDGICGDVASGGHTCKVASTFLSYWRPISTMYPTYPVLQKSVLIKLNNHI